jgi:hypothetical protein
MTFDEVRAMALALPQVEESTSYKTPAFRIRKRLIARLHQDGDALVVKVEPIEREALLATKPEQFFITPHYEDSTSWILARLDRVDPQELAELLAAAWRRLAPRRIVEAFDAGELD